MLYIVCKVPEKEWNRNDGEKGFVLTCGETTREKLCENKDYLGDRKGSELIADGAYNGLR
jgi:hypothetical protein